MDGSLPGSSVYGVFQGRILEWAAISYSRHDLCFFDVEFQASFFLFSVSSQIQLLSLSFFTLIKRLFSSSSLSAIRVISSAYLRVLIFHPGILIPACN